MVSSVGFIEHKEYGTCVEVRGHLYLFDGKYHMVIKDMKEMLRIYNRYKGYDKKRIEPEPTVKAGKKEKVEPTVTVIAGPACSVGGG